MLTVKIICSDGLELVKETKTAMLRPPSHSQRGSKYFSYFDEEGNSIDVFDGDVYVMNEHGKTVANYCLGHPKQYYDVKDIETN